MLPPEWGLSLCSAKYGLLLLRVHFSFQFKIDLLNAPQAYLPFIFAIDIWLEQ